MAIESGSPVRKKNRARWVLAGLFALFFVPIFGAILVAVVAPHWIPFGRINHGELLRPAVADALQVMTPLDGGEAVVRGPSQTWIIAHLSDGSCDEACELALVQMRQARLALGKDAHRVERWWLVTQRPGAGTMPRVLKLFPGLRVGLVQAQSAILLHADSSTVVYMVDPKGFLVLKYARGVSDDRSTPSASEPPASVAGSELASALRKDFKRLLKLSRER